MKANTLRFSGHETFPCRIHWLHKGVTYLCKNGNNAAAFNREDAVVHLGVGKNMVRSIVYWMHAFGILNDEGEINSSFLEDLVLFQAPGDDNWDEFILQKRFIPEEETGGW